MLEAIETNPKISIIVPTLDNFIHLQELISSIHSQTLLPSEIIIADSSSSNAIENGVKKINSSIPIIYLRVGKAYKYDRFLHSIFSLPFLIRFKEKFPPGRAFPYEATNAGAAIASSDWLGFLDATTIPRKEWLTDYWRLMQHYQCEVVFGKTKYFATTKFQKLLRASTYGKLGHETAPGTLMTKTNFLNGYKIKEGVRAGGDVEWKTRIKNNLRYHLPEQNYLSYSNLSVNLFSALKKFFIYQIYGAFLDIQNNVRDIYLGMTLLLGLITSQKWNSIVGGDSIFFIPHLTKIFLVSITCIACITFIINRGVLRGYSKNASNNNNFVKLAIFIIISYFVYRWNAVVADWVEESIWYFPHVTKIFFASIITASFLYRGVFFPLNNNIKPSYLFPFRWIAVGSLGVLLDLIKAPGYILGAVFSSILKRR
tara:strand:- start:383 stop:1663 length:1281 start_codon:yes stop_codon:yes gene_type:complete